MDKFKTGAAGSYELDEFKAEVSEKFQLELVDFSLFQLNGKQLISKGLTHKVIFLKEILHHMWQTKSSEFGHQLREKKYFGALSYGF